MEKGVLGLWGRLTEFQVVEKVGREVLAASGAVRDLLNIRQVLSVIQNLDLRPLARKGQRGVDDHCITLVKVVRRNLGKQ